MTLEANIDRVLGNKPPRASRSKVVATLLNDHPTKRGHMYFLALSRPISWVEDGSSAREYAQHAVVSEATLDFGGGEVEYETMIFPAYPDGRIASMSNIYGTTIKALDWKRAVRKARWALAGSNVGGGKRRRAVTTKYGPRGGQTEIQALLFPRSASWTQQRVSDWLEKNGYEWDLKIHPTEQYLRVRISDPDKFRRMRTKCLAKRKGKCIIKAVVGIR